MEGDLYKKTEEFVIESFTKAGNKRGIDHFLRTVYWVKELKPNAGEAMLIAAVAHDIERAYRDNEKINDVFKTKGFVDQNHLEYHQEKGAKIIEDFLKKEKAGNKLIKRVKALIEKHEFGGDDDQNVLRDADSISFFENNAMYFVENKVKECGKTHMKEKFDWMFNRMTNKQAKEISRPLFEKVMKNLDK